MGTCSGLGMYIKVSRFCHASVEWNGTLVYLYPTPNQRANPPISKDRVFSKSAAVSTKSALTVINNDFLALSLEAQIMHLRCTKSRHVSRLPESEPSISQVDHLSLKAPLLKNTSPIR